MRPTRRTTTHRHRILPFLLLLGYSCPCHANFHLRGPPTAPRGKHINLQVLDALDINTLPVLSTAPLLESILNRAASSSSSSASSPPPPFAGLLLQASNPATTTTSNGTTAPTISGTTPTQPGTTTNPGTSVSPTGTTVTPNTPPRTTTTDTAPTTGAAAAEGRAINTTEARAAVRDMIREVANGPFFTRVRDFAAAQQGPLASLELESTDGSRWSNDSGIQLFGREHRVTNTGQRDICDVRFQVVVQSDPHRFFVNHTYNTGDLTQGQSDTVATRVLGTDRPTLEGLVRPPYAQRMRMRETINFGYILQSYDRTPIDMGPAAIVSARYCDDDPSESLAQQQQQQRLPAGPQEPSQQSYSYSQSQPATGATTTPPTLQQQQQSQQGQGRQQGQGEQGSGTQQGGSPTGGRWEAGLNATALAQRLMNRRWWPDGEIVRDVLHNIREENNNPHTTDTNASPDAHTRTHTDAHTNTHAHTDSGAHTRADVHATGVETHEGHDRGVGGGGSRAEEEHRWWLNALRANLGNGR